MNFGGPPSGRDELDIGLIPLIDVLLVILIFLAATTAFVRPSALEVALPRAQDGAPVPQALELAVGRDGRYALDGALLQAEGPQQIARALRAAQPGPETMLLINADAQATHQSVVDVMEAARLAGISRVGFGARSP
ncbi:biopolymer transporter ExbD [Orrella sp. JC864]|uniref:ExbD/TolR family protein n=1 Tax=Orrella sp. JC864 TaxID=3120298 RepID=UPI0012BCAADB